MANKKTSICYSFAGNCDLDKTQKIVDIIVNRLLQVVQKEDGNVKDA